MKVLAFQIGLDRYGLRLRDINRVVPVAALKQLPLAPAWVAGLLDLHGAPVPVIDLSRLAGHAAAQVWVDTRIILLDCDAGGGSTRLLGLMAEHVLGIEEVEPGALADSGVDGAPFLGQVAASAAGMLQLVEPGQLLPLEVRASLFRAREAAP